MGENMGRSNLAVIVAAFGCLPTYTRQGGLMLKYIHNFPL